MSSRKLQKRPLLRKRVVNLRIEKMVPHMMELHTYRPYILHHQRAIGSYLMTGKGNKSELSVSADFIQNYCDKVQFALNLSKKTNRSIIRAGGKIPADITTELDNVRDQRNLLLDLLGEYKKFRGQH